MIAQKGYEGASVGDIAVPAGYTKGALYANLGSKEELFLEVARGLLADDAALKDSQVTPDLRDVFEPHPESDEQATRTLLALELYLYPLRHAEARADIVPLLAAAQEGVAALVHRSVADDPTGDPTQDERDLGFVLMALHTLGALVEVFQAGNARRRKRGGSAAVVAGTPSEPISASLDVPEKSGRAVFTVGT